MLLVKHLLWTVLRWTSCPSALISISSLFKRFDGIFRISLNSSIEFVFSDVLSLLFPAVEGLYIYFFFFLCGFCISDC